jgi:hypothetical protein
MHGNPPNPTDAEVVMFDPEDGDCDGRPLTQAELDSVVYPDAPWELHMDFDDRVIKEDSFSQLRQMVCYSQHSTDSISTSRIEICTPHRTVGSIWYRLYDASPWQCEFSTAVQIKRVEVFEEDATVQDVLDRIAGGMCYGYFEGIREAWGDRGLSSEGRPVFELVWGHRNVMTSRCSAPV